MNVNTLGISLCAWSAFRLNEKYERIMISPGYKEPLDMIKELHFAAEEHYSKTTWEAYSKTH